VLEANLLRLCALTDRGQRASPEQESELRAAMAALEAVAPPADALDINGEWRLLAACGETAYRSSPFFWAFRQATARWTSPVGLKGAAAGGPLASAVLAVTDNIPFYDIGSVVQRIGGVCSEERGCPVPEKDADGSSDGASSEAEPSDGTSAPIPDGAGTLESQVELIVGRNFGLPEAKSLMTTTASVRPLPPSGSILEVELRVERTSAEQSSIEALLPGFGDAFRFPSGDALDALSPRSSTVVLQTTYLSSSLRISRPRLDLSAAPAPADEARSAFVYARA